MDNSYLMDLKHLKEMLGDYEGTRDKVYDDENGQPVVPGYTMKGHPTIGKGRALDVNGLRDDEIELLFENDVQRCIDELTGVDWFEALDGPRKEAIVAMNFQLGLGGLLKFKKMIQALRDCDFEKAAIEALDSRWAKQTSSRAADMAEIIRSGERKG